MVSEELLARVRCGLEAAKEAGLDWPGLAALLDACAEANRRSRLLAEACVAGGGLDAEGLEEIRKVSDDASARWDAIDQASTESTAAAGELVADIHASLRSLLVHAATLEALLADAEDALRMHKRGYGEGRRAAIEAAAKAAEAVRDTITDSVAGIALGRALGAIRAMAKEGA